MRVPLESDRESEKTSAAVGSGFLDSAWIAAAESLAIPTGLITAAFLTRRLGPSDYALLSLAASVVTWIQWTIAALWSRAAVKSVASSARPLKTAAAFVRLYALSGLFTAAAVAAGAELISTFLSNASLAGPLRLYAVDLAVFSLTHGYRAVHAGLGNFRSRAYGTALRWSVRLVLVVALVSAGYGVKGAIWGNIGASIVELLVNRWGSLVRLSVPVSIDWKELFKQTSAIALSGVSLRLFERMDLLFLSGLGMPASIVGGYGAAQNLTIVAGIVTASVSPVLLSSITRALRQGDSKGADQTAYTAVRAAFLTIPYMAAAGACSFGIARSIFGSYFDFIGPALRVLLFAIPGTIALSFLQCILIARHHTRSVAGITLAMMAVGAMAHPVVIPKYGMVGAAAVTCTLLMAAVVATAIEAVSIGVRLPVATLIRSAVVAAVILIADTFGIVRQGNVWWMLAVLSAVSLMLQIVSGEFSKQERALIIGKIGQTLRRNREFRTE